MFGRATITLGIGPHSSFRLCRSDVVVWVRSRSPPFIDPTEAGSYSTPLLGSGDLQVE